MEGNFLPDLSCDIGKLLSSGDNYDVIIQAGEGQYMKEFFAHSLILGARSTYFKAALSKEWVEKANGILIFKKPNISPEIFELILKFLYTGIVNLDNLNGTQALKLLIATDELNLQKLGDYIQTCMINNQDEYLRKVPVEIIQIIFQLEGFESLRNNFLENLCKNPEALFKSPKFISLEKDLIIYLLKQNELEMEEIEIWNYILKWGISKISTPLDIDNLSRWTSNDFEELENILHDIIPHIRWFQIPAKMFWRKISRFEQIFPKQLYRDIIGYHIDPDESPSTLVLPQRIKVSLDSVLIDINHFLVIAGWINNKDKSFYHSGNIPYSLKLLYRASRDGFDAKKFHELCDNKGSTIMISKLQENDKLIGGYNPLDWKHSSSGKWGTTSDSFLFSFTSKNDINSGYITRVANNIEKQQKAVYYRSDIGPAFGSGCDLFIQNDNIFGNFSGHTYPEVKIIVSIPKVIVDYEVFQVTI